MTLSKEAKACLKARNRARRYRDRKTAADAAKAADAKLQESLDSIEAVMAQEAEAIAKRKAEEASRKCTVCGLQPPVTKLDGLWYCTAHTPLEQDDTDRPENPVVTDGVFPYVAAADWEICADCRRLPTWQTVQAGRPTLLYCQYHRPERLVPVARPGQVIGSLPNLGQQAVDNGGYTFTVANGHESRQTREELVRRYHEAHRVGAYDSHEFIASLYAQVEQEIKRKEGKDEY